MVTKNSATHPTVTVVIPVYNEAYSIGQCIRSLQAQDYPGELSILVIDNNCTDQSAAIARSLGCTVIAESRAGYVHAVRRGFSEAKSDIIAMTDGDSIVPTGWVSRIVGNLTHNNTLAVSGSLRFHDGPLWFRLIGRVFGKLNWHLAGANMAMWRSTYLRCGGFNPDMNMGVDVEIGFRIKKLGRIMIDRALYVYTSARRFEKDFFGTLVLYYLNDLALVLTRKPVFYNFSAVRITPGSDTGIRPFFRASFVTIILMSFILVSQNPSSQIMGYVMAHGKESSSIVALSFDNVPGPSTSQILDILSDYKQKATFFCNVRQIEQYPTIAKRIASEGHAIDTRMSESMLLPIKTPSTQTHDRIEHATAVIYRAIGLQKNFFKTPAAIERQKIKWIARQNGYSVVALSISDTDWETLSPDGIADKILSTISSGSIIMLHDTFKTTDMPRINTMAAVLPILLDKLKERGYTLVTIPQLPQPLEEYHIAIAPLLQQAIGTH